MNHQSCCEEMGELLKSVQADESCGIKIFANEGDPCEIGIVNDGGSYVPNVILRFCPYCGKILDKSQITMTNNDFLNELSEIVFSEELEGEEPLPLPRAQVVFEETIERVRGLVRSAIASQDVTRGIKKS